MLSAEAKLLTRVAQDIDSGMTVNLGIGLPSLMVNFIKDPSVSFHAENGLVGIGPVAPPEKANRNLIDSGGAYVSTVAGSAFMDSALSFAIVRSGRLDLTLLGAFEVSRSGDLANWKVPGKFSPGIGGAMELAQKSRKVGVIMKHTDRNGNPKILEKCSLPLTAKKCVDRIYTDLAVIDVTKNGLKLIEISTETSIEEVKALTAAELDTESVKISGA